MTMPSRYWTMWRFEAIEGGGIRTRGRKCDRAQGFFQRQFPQWETRQQLSATEEREIQNTLLSAFRQPSADAETQFDRALAGLCLRCYVSYDILHTCHQLVAKYGKNETSPEGVLNDLLPLVLSDIEDLFIVPDAKGNFYQIRESDPLARGRTATGIALKILKSYQLSEASKSLKNWTNLLVRQSEEIEKCLLEYSISLSTSWSLLKKATPRLLADFSDRDRRIVEVFQAVYRRDLRTEAHSGRPHPEPSEAQLIEIIEFLKPPNIAIDSTKELLKTLKEIAEVLRQSEIWKRRKHPSKSQTVPMEIETESGDAIEYIDDFKSTLDPSRQEEQELLKFLYEQLQFALESGIREGIEDRTIELSQSRSYAPFANQFMRGLCLLYVRNLPQKQIARELEISTQSKVSRIFSPKALLLQVRFRTLEKLIEIVLQKARDLGLTRIPPDPHYLSHLVCQLENFIDAEIFNEATSEVMAGSNRSLNSIYARQLRSILSQTGFAPPSSPE